MGQAFLFLLFLLPPAMAEIKIAILMQGSDFINVSVVPTFDVAQFDLGDVFISPCRAGTYNEARDSYCKDCSICTSYQYEEYDCISTRNRVCPNCTICSDREQEICACQQRSSECLTGNRVCFPLPASTINITFDMTVSTQLSPLKERFLMEGLRTGFILFLADFLAHSPDSILLVYMQKTSSRVYFVNYLVNDVYSLITKRQAELLTQPVVQGGLTSTFGVQSNTFSTVSQQRRRLLQAQPSQPITLTTGNVDASCVIVGGCGRFFNMSDSENPCDRKCNALPCPPGYEGILGQCTICPNATFKVSEGNATCTPCPKGAFSDEGSTSPDSCWVPTTTPKPTTTTTGAAPPTTTTPAAVVSESSAATNAGTAPKTTATTTTTTSQRQQTLLATSLLQTPAPTTGLPSTTASIPIVATSSIPPVTTTPAQGGWLPSGLVNMTTINNFYYKYVWNSGHAGAVQYIIIQDSREQWALHMVVLLMVVGLLVISTIGARVFLAWPSRPAGYSRLAPRREIQLPIRLPDPESSGSDDDRHHPESKRKKEFFPLMPKGGFLGQRRFSRSLDGDY